MFSRQYLTVIVIGICCSVTGGRVVLTGFIKFPVQLAKILLNALFRYIQIFIKTWFMSYSLPAQIGVELIRDLVEDAKESIIFQNVLSLVKRAVKKMIENSIHRFLTRFFPTVLEVEHTTIPAKHSYKASNVIQLRKLFPHLPPQVLNKIVLSFPE